MVNRVLFNRTYRQFAIIPTVGIVTGGFGWKFRVAAMWLFWRVSIGFIKEDQQ